MLLLKLLECEINCLAVMAGGHAVGLAKRVAALLDECIAKEGADKGCVPDSGRLDVLLQVGVLFLSVYFYMHVELSVCLSACLSAILL